MRPAHVVDILTPKKVQLNGLWFGPRKPKRVIVWVHGLGSSAFSKGPIVDALIDAETAVLTFNNRGHDKVSVVSRGKARIYGGSAHEVFTDCVDDIEGAIRLAKSSGAKDIFLAGHSTGCQKSIYWAAKKGLPAGRQGGGNEVKGIILLAPISDYAAEMHLSGKEKIAKGLKIAKKLIQAGKPHELVPAGTIEWSLIADAQRFVSLYSGESAEEIFPYWAPKRTPKTLKKVKLPVLVFLADEDQYADRPSREMEEWFMRHIGDWRGVITVNHVDHSFAGGEEVVVRHTGGFMREVTEAPKR